MTSWIQRIEDVRERSASSSMSSCQFVLITIAEIWNNIHHVVAVLVKVTEVRYLACLNKLRVSQYFFCDCHSHHYKIPQSLFFDRRGKRKKIERRNTTKSEQKWEEIARGENCFFFPTNETRSAHSVRVRRRARSLSLDYKQATKLLIAVNLCPPLFQNIL